MKRQTTSIKTTKNWMKHSITVEIPLKPSYFTWNLYKMSPCPVHVLMCIHLMSFLVSHRSATCMFGNLKFLLIRHRHGIYLASCLGLFSAVVNNLLTFLVCLIHGSRYLSTRDEESESERKQWKWWKKHHKSSINSTAFWKHFVAFQILFFFIEKQRLVFS